MFSVLLRVISQVPTTMLVCDSVFYLFARLGRHVRFVFDARTFVILPLAAAVPCQNAYQPRLCVLTRYVIHTKHSCVL